MYGAMIVDPRMAGPAQELVFVQSDFYLMDGENGIKVRTTRKMLGNGNMDYVVFNGYATQYVEEPIVVKAGEPIRIFLVNAGPNAYSTFHVVGAIFTGLPQRQSPQRALRPAVVDGRTWRWGVLRIHARRARDLPGRQPRLRTRGPRRNRPAAGRVVRSPGAVRRFDSEREGIAHRCQRVEEQSRVPYLASQQWMVRPSRDDHGSCDGINRRRLRGRISGAVRYILLGALSLVSIGVGLRAPRRVNRRRSIHAAAAVPTSAWCCQGRRQMECSPWSFHRGPPRTSGLGGRGYTMPDVIQLTAGDTIVLRNDDSVPHMILYAFLMPGQTHERTLDTRLRGVQLRLWRARRVVPEFHHHLRQRAGPVTGMSEAGRHQRHVELAPTDRRDGQPLG